MSRPIRWCFLAEPPRLTRGETPRLIPPQDEKSGALGLFCKWLQAFDFMSRRLRGQLAERRADAGRKPAWLKMLGPVNVTDETIGEYWDQAHCERYIASVDWDVPDQRRIARRRS